jgi:hypothetical protein
MKFRLLGGSLIVALLISSVFGQSASQLTKKLTASEQALVDGSKKAILNTGLSENYFNAHFKLLNVVDKPSDRRIVWQFSINQHQTVVNDSIGFYTQGTKRVNTHSVERTLGQTSEISRTLTRSRALKIMKSCIGNFDNPVVEYGPVDGRAELLLVANARTRVESKSEREEEREREQKERDKQKAVAAGTDVIKTEEDEGKEPPVIFGFVNLRTGKCTKGAALTSPFVQ